MSGDFSEVSSESWFSRLMESIKGVLIGLLLFVVSFPLLAWNEYRSVVTARSLAEGGKQLVSVENKSVNKDNEDKFVHMTGMATTDDTVKDEDFGISAPKVIRLARKVEMYQWEEKKKTEEKKKLGGGKEKKVTYSYDKVWSAKPIDTSTFHPEGKAQKEESTGVKLVNPPMPYESKSFTAAKVTLGAFTLPPVLVAEIHKSEPFTIPAESASKAPKDFKLTEGGQGFYKGKSSGTPAIGDVRVAYTVVKPLEVSVYGQQAGDTLRPFPTKSGDALIRLREGNMSGQAMIKAAEGENATLTWILRLVGFVLMAVGVYLVVRPLVVVADVVPFIGDFLSVGAGIFAGLVALPLTLITIAICWIAVRPLLGIGLLVGAAVVIVGGIFLARRGAKPKPPAQPA